MEMAVAGLKEQPSRQGNDCVLNEGGHRYLEKNGFCFLQL